MTLHLSPLPAFEDNYIWTLHDDAGRAIVVDPGDARPVLAAAAQGLKPVTVLITHHHPDHIGGIAELRARYAPSCFGPVDARIDGIDRRVGDGDRIEALGLDFEVLSVPGHTRSHIAFRAGDLLFCGDTLFSLGCGRLFEGTPSQMLASLDRLAALPSDTRVCCTHEYTLGNAAFALTVDPDNAPLRERVEQAREQRARGLPTLPTSLDCERRCNPFLRVDAPAIRKAVETHTGQPPADRLACFTALRQWKDGFRA